MPTPRLPTRRQLLLAGGAATLGLPAIAAPGRILPPMTDGPFYPPRAWRARWPDWDADLTQVAGADPARRARGEHLALELLVHDTQGRRVDGVEVEIWQCDAMAA